MPEPQEPLDVVALDEAGKPVTGATVNLDAWPSSSDDPHRLLRHAGFLEPESAVTNAEGEARFFDLPPSTYQASVVREGFVRRFGLAVRPGEVLVVTLRPGRMLRGRVVDMDDGTPVKNALVEIHGLDTSRREVTRAASLSRGDGTFEVYGLGDSALTVTVSALGFERAQWTWTPEMPWDQIALQRAFAGISGLLRSKATHQPVAGARVRAGDVATRTDGDGRFFLSNPVRVGETMALEECARIDLIVTHRSFAGWSQEVLPQLGPEPLDLGIIDLSPRPPLSGSVVGVRGEAVRDAFVLLAEMGADLSDRSVLRQCPRARTDESGRFSFTEFEERGPRREVVALAPGHPPGVACVDSLRKEDVTVHLPSGIDMALSVPGMTDATSVALEELGLEGKPRTILRRLHGQRGPRGSVVFSGVRPGFLRLHVPDTGILELDGSKPLQLSVDLFGRGFSMGPDEAQDATTGED